MPWWVRLASGARRCASAETGHSGAPKSSAKVVDIVVDIQHQSGGCCWISNTGVAKAWLCGRCTLATDAVGVQDWCQTGRPASMPDYFNGGAFVLVCKDVTSIGGIRARGVAFGTCAAMFDAHPIWRRVIALLPAVAVSGRHLAGALRGRVRNYPDHEDGQ
jgi:hypothetical protein